MFKTLEEINLRPKIFGAYTAESLWSDSHRAKQMLTFHLNEHIDVSSRNHKFIESSIEWMKEEFALNIGSKICDFGCGPGLYTSKFARLGADVTGIDFSASSIEYANEKASELGLNIKYINANYLDVSLPTQYDLITMIMCDFCALNPKQRASLLAKFSDLLSHSGKLVMDVYSVSSFDAKEEVSGYERNHLNHFWYQEDYYCFSNTFKYEEEKVILDKYSLFTQSGKSEVVYNWLQCFSLETLKQELANAGLRVQAVYSDVCGNNYNPNLTEFAVVVERNI
ncbi:class I SAM-dependent methyltransferase [Gynuella sunshinyii]|uniref:2-polyprenyl-3-methyl-5-hydroxy-6-metoxy-1, 4-benzoquinol methylase n=1 Tax=Gynuella sunshinyii YC6258 TaxID=1445510 RepID=A0A0C5VJH3_9GAMM|nr:class I SAM-dependent methyltransferase [Gynuella sunshinyii]AJQ94777.1 2-polyprenyl-3-methyl-5-hydroxy-6-metoxy-1,4-benzoquinol methylase [Gynuella sunshinyii YC6258]